MDFLNKSMQQIGDLLKAMSPAARVTAGLLLAVVVISLVYLFRYQGTSPNNYLLAARAFSSSELAAMEAAFSQAGLNDYEIEGSKVRVPRSQRSAYLAALAEYGALPQNFDSMLAEALSNNSPFESQSARQQRVQYAVQRDVARVISNMSGIESATVYFDEINERGLRGTRKYTAAVSVQPLGSASLDSKLVDSIRKFVAATQAGMRPEDVTVTDLVSGRTYTMPTDETSQLAARYAEQKLSFEQQWREKIMSILSYIPGAQIEVNVELDPTLQHESYSRQADPKVTPLYSQSSSTVESQSTGAPSGQPGPATNVTAMQPAQVATSQDTSESEKREEMQINADSHSVQVESVAPLTPEVVTVSVALPTSYYEDLWRSNNPAAPGEEQTLPDDGALQQLAEEVKTQVQEQVVNLLPQPKNGENGYPRVVVTSYTRITGPAPEEPGVGFTVWEWFTTHGSQVAMVVVGLFGLLILRGVVRGGSGGKSPSPAEELEGFEQPLRVHEDHPEEHESEEESPVTPKRKRKFAAGGPSLRDELADMVREDPDTAANILKSWISDAA